MTSRSQGPEPAQVAWDKMANLVPAVVQDAGTGSVLMLGYMSRAALEQTITTKLVTFYSRSKERLWQKGETSGHVLHLVDWALDCDADSLLILALPVGPTCHQGCQSCFGETGWELGRLSQTIAKRTAADADAGSYTGQLLAGGVRRQAQKVGEEGVEVALAAVAQPDSELAGEVADLLYHLLVLLKGRGLTFSAVMQALAARRAK